MSWSTLSWTTAEILALYPQLSLSPVPGLPNLRRDALVGTLLAITASFARMGLEIRYRGTEHLSGHPVLVANHQGGNLDALVIASILLKETKRPVYVPTSQRLLEQAFIGMISSSLQYVGSIFIRSTFDDPSYQEEIASLLSGVITSRQHLLFFPEGATSKAGKPNPFRRGLIKSLLSRQDVTFCPISLTYESPLNDQGVRDETFSPLSAMNGLLQRRGGVVYVNFGPCHRFAQGEDHRQVTRTLQTAVCSKIPVLTVDLVATLLPSGSKSLIDLSSELRRLEAIVTSSELDYLPSSLESALSSLQHLLSLHDGQLAVTNPTALWFYRNRLLPLYYNLVSTTELLANECVWSTSLPPSSLRSLAVQTVSPLVTVYHRLLQAVQGGCHDRKELQSLALQYPGTSCYTARNFLLYLNDYYQIKI